MHYLKKRGSLGKFQQKIYIKNVVFVKQNLIMDTIFFAFASKKSLELTDFVYHFTLTHNRQNLS